MENTVTLWHISSCCSDSLGPIPNEGYAESPGSTAHRWLGWPGQKEGDSLGERRLGKGMSGILKIMTSLDNGSMKYITQPKLPECCRAPFKVSRWEVSNKNKEVPPDTASCQLKPWPQVEP